MKKIKQLTPYFRDLNGEEREHQIEMRKMKALEKWLEKNIPYAIKGKYSFDSMGSSCIRVFIYLDKDEDSTIKVLKWLPQLKNKRFKIEKFWRKESGVFSYKIEREYRSYNSYIIFFENTANIDGCVVKKKRKMQTIYVTDCETERVIL